MRRKNRWRNINQTRRNRRMRKNVRENVRKIVRKKVRKKNVRRKKVRNKWRMKRVKKNIQLFSVRKRKASRSLESQRQIHQKTWHNSKCQVQRMRVIDFRTQEQRCKTKGQCTRHCSTIIARSKATAESKG